VRWSHPSCRQPVGRLAPFPSRASPHPNDRLGPFRSSRSVGPFWCSHVDAPGMRDGPIRLPAPEPPPSRASQPRWRSPIDVSGKESQRSFEEHALCHPGNGQKPSLFSESSDRYPGGREFVRVSCRISRTPVVHCLHSLHFMHASLPALSPCAHAQERSTPGSRTQ
jgi:hypothetical protein